jgi:hypothetical protein
MADNLDVTPGTGSTVACDDVGGVLYQRVRLAVGVDGTAADASLAAPLPTSDAGPAWTTSYTYTTSADMTSAADLTAAPTGGQKLVITDIVVSSDTAILFSFKEETSGTVIGAIRIAADGVAQITPRGKWKLATADKKLQGLASAAANVYVTVFYYSE